MRCGYLCLKRASAAKTKILQNLRLLCLLCLRACSALLSKRQRQSTSKLSRRICSGHCWRGAPLSCSCRKIYAPSDLRRGHPFGARTRAQLLLAEGAPRQQLPKPFGAQHRPPARLLSFDKHWPWAPRRRPVAQPNFCFSKSHSGAKQSA